MSLTPEALAELERLEKAATPGPWRWTNTWGMRYSAGPNKGEWCDPPDTRHDFCRMIAGEECEVFDDGSACGEYGGLKLDDPDCEYIAALRNHAPALIAAARRLGEVQMMMDTIAHVVGAVHDQSTGPSYPGDSVEVLAATRTMQQQLTAANARVAELTQRAEAAEAVLRRIADVKDMSEGPNMSGRLAVRAALFQRFAREHLATLAAAKSQDGTKEGE